MRLDRIGKSAGLVSKFCMLEVYWGAFVDSGCSIVSLLLIPCNFLFEFWFVRGCSSEIMDSLSENSFES